MSNGRRPRLTDADWDTIKRALNDAMHDRAGYADAWKNGAPERAEALEQVKRYESLHGKMFGRPSARQRTIDRLAEMPTITVVELAKRAFKTDDQP